MVVLAAILCPEAADDPVDPRCAHRRVRVDPQLPHWHVDFRASSSKVRVSRASARVDRGVGGREAHWHVRRPYTVVSHRVVRDPGEVPTHGPGSPHRPGFASEFLES